MYKFKIMCLLPVFIAALCVSTFTNLSNCYASVEELDYFLGYGGLEYDDNCTAVWSDPSMVEIAYEDGIYKVTFIKEGDVSVTFGYGEDIEPLTLICHVKPETYNYIIPDKDAYIKYFIKKVNEFRSQNGLTPLTISKALTDGAAARAIEIHTAGKNTGLRPDGRPFYTVMAPAEYERRTIYEFYAFNAGANSEFGVDKFLFHLFTKASHEGFSEKVLNNPNVTEIGLATYEYHDSNGDIRAYTDVIFAR